MPPQAQVHFKILCKLVLKHKGAKLAPIPKTFFLNTNRQILILRFCGKKQLENIFEKSNLNHVTFSAKLQPKQSYLFPYLKSGNNHETTCSIKNKYYP